MLDLLKKIASVGSPAEKLKLLQQYPYQEELKTTLKLATDPFITFGITDFDEGVTAENRDPLFVLNQLANRELTGNSARFSLGAACADLDPDEKEVIRRILRKDLRCGLGEKLVLQQYPGLIQQFEVMRADKFKGIGSRGHYHIEPKYDGLRCVGLVRGGSVTLFSRNGKEFTSSDHLKPQILRMAPKGLDCVFDGELTSGNFNQSSSAVRKKNVQDDSIVYNIFDFLDMDEWKKPVKTYAQRRGSLEYIFQSVDNLVLTPSYPIHSDDEAFMYYNRFLDAGYEGGIVKNGKGLYRFRRHRDWMKLKEVNEVDLVVESLIQGEGKYYGMLGAAVVRYHGKKVNIGTGFSNTERELYWKDPTLLVHKVIEVHYHQETPDGSLRHPRFHRIREDKSITA